ncbi:serine/arginine repetitive matrix protein 2 isoform X1 [Cydia pomonella]|uniref:serine/arginine repetitive matrix protein 2 isoform X1 n=1 Tax=Cydia pomonella TaxID=82600 RepID=UPI002ADD4A30|nr:serine/arginine repetitive matrix protein 2 isoform X1 [Cydia pomonella]
MEGAPAPAPGPRQSRRGPAPFASFDHDVSDEVRQASSPESKQTFQLPEIVEDTAASPGGSLAPPEQRARSHSSPAVAGALGAAPRIDISRASSSSHHDSRDSSPEMALFAGTAEDADTRGRLDIGFREDGAAELRSSTEELAFLEGAPGEPNRPQQPQPPPLPPPNTSVSRRHSRKDSQGSEAALLAVSGRTSRLSSVGSQCSAHSALSGFSHASRVSRLSVVSGTSRSPSPHKMLLETSFCGPKPIETDPEICAAAVEERLLELVRATDPAPVPANTRDRREVRTEVTVESTSTRPAAPRAPAPTPVPTKPTATEPAVVVAVTPAEEKRQKETRNQARAVRSKERSSEPEVYKNRNRSKDIIRIKLKPDSEYEDDDDESEHTLVAAETRKPATLELATGCASPLPQRRSPSPAGGPTSRKSSFCSLFKSRETIASPDSPSGLRRKKSLTEGRSRSKSRDRDRDRSTTPSSAGKLRGSVLSLFKTPRRSGASLSPSSRTGSRASSPGPPCVPPPDRSRRSSEKLKYYEDGGVIHIPLRTPPDERPSSCARRPGSEPDARVEILPEPARPASAPHPRERPEPLPSVSSVNAQKPVHRTVLPDGSIIIPLHSPTERTASSNPEPPVTVPAPAPAPDSDTVTPDSRHSVTSSESRRSVVTPDSRVGTTSESKHIDDSRNGDMRTSSSDEGRVEVAPETAPTAERRKQRLVFTTHVGSREQVFSTQFSITKTPSVTSEISESLPSFEPSLPDDRPSLLRDTHITCAEPTPCPAPPAPVMKSPPGSDAERASVGSRRSLAETRSPTRGSSDSEGSSEATPARGGSDVEQRGLVVQESFEDELPYVPTTLPLERSLALPMVPVRERGARVATAGTRRPRAPSAPRTPAPPPPPPTPAAPTGEKLRIKLPRRPRTASASGPPRPERPRTRSGGGGPPESRAKSEWIDFEEVPERRKQPKRIQTLPAAAASEARDVVFSYVEPEECRCECHANARQDDELPLLTGPSDSQELDLSSPEGCSVELRVAARPFVADFDLRAPDVDPPPIDAPARPTSRRH